MKYAKKEQGSYAATSSLIETKFTNEIMQVHLTVTASGDLIIAEDEKKEIVSVCIKYFGESVSPGKTAKPKTVRQKSQKICDTSTGKVVTVVKSKDSSGVGQLRRSQHV